ncbi:MAG TPA: GNAT family N-acetyltransferase [Chloroflexota bacterium]|nr:GNAT family N-acetyltransferase [Chloroflexota bacterium]
MTLDSTSMTVEWRAGSPRMPEYRSDLDLVVVAPDGRLAGFCIGWLGLERRAAQIEPIGIDPDFQGRGLSRTLLLEMLHRFKALGAEHAQVETDTSRLPALHAYEAVGFRPQYKSFRRGQWFS